jgi:hypothetical protein
MSHSNVLHRGRRTALAAAAAALGAIAVAAPAAPAAVSPSATIVPETGFPFSYTDDDGVSLALCLDGPPLCINTPRPDPTQPASVPENFPPDGEAFWFQAEASMPVGIGGDALLVLAQEAAFDTGTPAAGHQISFSRIRVKASGLVPGAEYTITHPYGVDTVTADAEGTILTTDDAGCLAPPCNFATAPTGRVTSFLRWDPTVAPAPPAGYIGDAASEHAVIGSPEGTDFFRISGPNAGGPRVNSVTQSRFIVQGKLAGDPPPPAPHPVLSTRDLAFPDRQVGSASAPQTVTVTNHGTAAQAIGAAAIGGLHPADYQITADSCSNQSIAPATSCSVSVAFNPTATGARSASLVLSDNSRTSPHAVSLTGAATPGPAPAPVIVVAAPAPAPSPAPAPPAATPALRAAQVSAPSRVRLANARRSGIAVRFTISRPARVARVELFRGTRRVDARTVRGTGRKSVRFTRRLQLGRYSVRIRVGRTIASLGRAVTRRITVVR